MWLVFLLSPLKLGSHAIDYSCGLVFSRFLDISTSKRIETRGLLLSGCLLVLFRTLAHSNQSLFRLSRLSPSFVLHFIAFLPLFLPICHGFTLADEFGRKIYLFLFNSPVSPLLFLLATCFLVAPCSVSLYFLSIFSIFLAPRVPSLPPPSPSPAADSSLCNFTYTCRQIGEEGSDKSGCCLGAESFIHPDFSERDLWTRVFGVREGVLKLGSTRTNALNVAASKKIVKSHSNSLNIGLASSTCHLVAYSQHETDMLHLISVSLTCLLLRVLYSRII